MRVTALHLETGLTREAESGAGGEFVLPSMPVGAYEVRAELAGFRPLAQRGITVLLGEPAVLALTLEVGRSRRGHRRRPTPAGSRREAASSATW